MGRGGERGARRRAYRATDGMPGSVLAWPRPLAQAWRRPIDGAWLRPGRGLEEAYRPGLEEASGRAGKTSVHQKT